MCPGSGEGAAAAGCGPAPGPPGRLDPGGRPAGAPASLQDPVGPPGASSITGPAVPGYWAGPGEAPPGRGVSGSGRRGPDRSAAPARRSGCGPRRGPPASEQGGLPGSAPSRRSTRRRSVSSTPPPWRALTTSVRSAPASTDCRTTGTRCAVFPASSSPVSPASPATAPCGVRVEPASCVRPVDREGPAAASTARPHFAARLVLHAESVGGLLPDAAGEGKRPAGGAGRRVGELVANRLDGVEAMGGVVAHPSPGVLGAGPDGVAGPQGRRSRNGQASGPAAVTRRTGPWRPTRRDRRSRGDHPGDLGPLSGRTFGFWIGMA